MNFLNHVEFNSALEFKISSQLFLLKEMKEKNDFTFYFTYYANTTTKIVKM